MNKPDRARASRRLLGVVVATAAAVLGLGGYAAEAAVLSYTPMALATAGPGPTALPQAKWVTVLDKQVPAGSWMVSAGLRSQAAPLS